MRAAGDVCGWLAQNCSCDASNDGMVAVRCAGVVKGADSHPSLRGDGLLASLEVAVDNIPSGFEDVVAAAIRQYSDVFGSAATISRGAAAALLWLEWRSARHHLCVNWTVRSGRKGKSCSEGRLAEELATALAVGGTGESDIVTLLRVRLLSAEPLPLVDHGSTVQSFDTVHMAAHLEPITKIDVET